MNGKRQTYLGLLEKGVIRTNTMRVLEYVYKNPGTDIGEMRKALNMVHQTLTPALSNLMDSGLIKENGTNVVGGDSYYSCLWFVADPLEQEKLADDRRNDGFKRWLSKGINEYGDYLPKSIMDELRNYEQMINTEV